MRIERSYDKINKVRIENSILVKELGKPEYHASGVVRRPDETPLTPVARAAVSLAGELGRAVKASLASRTFVREAQTRSREPDR